MNAIQPFHFAPAVRERVSLIIMLAGASGSGKTLSALKMARGLAGGDDNKIAVIDTESGRAKHYAPAPGQQRNGDKFSFQHGSMQAPFTPERYIDAIAAADNAGFEVVVIDSVTHEWEGEGGLQDMHTELVEKTVEKSRSDAAEKGWNFNEAAAADRASIGAWKEPKMRHKRFVSRLLQCRAHLILCFRADEKMRMETIEEEGRNGKVFKKTIITQPKDLPPAERWVPICERRMPYEMTLSCILTPVSPGAPIPIKLQAQHRHAFPDGSLLSEETGRLLAEWARGGAAPIASASQPRDLGALGHAAARAGTEALRQFWTSLSKADKASVGSAAQLDEWKRIAAEAETPDIDFDGPSKDPADSAAVTDGSVSPQGAPSVHSSSPATQEQAGDGKPAAAGRVAASKSAGAAGNESAPAQLPDLKAASEAGLAECRRYLAAHPDAEKTLGRTAIELAMSAAEAIDVKKSADSKKAAILADIVRTGDAKAKEGQEALDGFLDDLTGDEQAMLTHAQVKGWRETAGKVAAQ